MNTRNKYEQAAQRKIAIDAGFYDGRFKTKTIENKKKREEKRASRDFKLTAKYSY